MTAAPETPTPVTSTPLDAAEAVARARALVPAVRAAADETESLRRVPPALIEALRGAGLVRMLTPRRFGGHGLDFDAFIAATLEIARADASVAWCFAFLNVHAWLLAGFPERAQTEVWTTHPDATIAYVNVPAGQVTVVDGGFRLAGTWPWASGIDHCDLAILAGVVPPAPGDPPGPPDARLFIVSRADLEIQDTWHVAGLRGTGSHHVVVADAFVPGHRVASLLELREGTGPGRALHPEPIFHLPLLAALAICLAAPILGATLGAYDVWLEAMRARVTTFSREQVAELSHQQIRVAEVAADIRCADLLLRGALDVLRPGGPLTLEQRVLLRRDYAYVATLCLRAVETMYSASGGPANYDSDPLQRRWRDIHAMAAHTAVNLDSAAVNFGRMELGQPLNPKDPLF